jgi:hypothetical protein
VSNVRGIWGFGWLLSATADWCKKIAIGCRRFAGGIADRSRMAGREDESAVGRLRTASRTVQVDLGGGVVEFKEFIKELRVGDRIRAFCDDGVIEAEKVSATRFKLIYAVEKTGAIH